MPVLTPTKDTGALATPLPGLSVPPAQQLTDDARAAFLAGQGLNGEFMAELLSAMLAHERCGRHLYRAVEARSNNAMLVRKYRSFGEETEEHVAILEELIAAAGGSPTYVGPMARAVQGSDTKLVESTFALAGSVDLVTAEMVMLDAVFLAESMDHANWSGLGQIVQMMDGSELRTRFVDAVNRVEDEEDTHLHWARTTKQRLTGMHASSGAMAALGAKAEELMAVVQGWFSDDA